MVEMGLDGLEKNTLPSNLNYLNHSKLSPKPS